MTKRSCSTAGSWISLTRLDKNELMVLVEVWADESSWLLPFSKALIVAPAILNAILLMPTVLDGHGFLDSDGGSLCFVVIRIGEKVLASRGVHRGKVTNSGCTHKGPLVIKNLIKC